MNTYKLCLLLALGAGSLTVAQAQTAGSPSLSTPQSSIALPQQVLHEASSDTGSLMPKALVWNSSIPLNKTYEQLSPKQKADFLALYESMAPGDEPPFPLEGMKPIFNAVKKVQFKLKARGELNLAVTVGPDGKATKVEDYGATDKHEMADFASSVLLMTKFKPAICNGKPCAMQFPFRLRLTG
jgi:hypothetical protein